MIARSPGSQQGGREMERDVSQEVNVGVPGPALSRSRLPSVALAISRWSLVLLGLLTALAAYVSSQLIPLLLGLMLAGAVWGVVGAIIAAYKGRLTRGVWPGSAAPHLRWLGWQAINRLLFWGIATLSMLWILPRDLLSHDEFTSIRWLIIALGSVNIVATLLPAARPVRLSWNVATFLGWLFLATECGRILAGPPAPHIELASPFEGTWAVIQGGRSALVNHHYPIPAQSHALDLIKLQDGKAAADDSRTLESYYAFVAPLLAPADGEVAIAVDGLPDMEIGQTDTESLVGNHVVIEIGDGRYVLFAHLKRGSVRVKPGQAVSTGQTIGECGNSGNTSQPHLHLQVQSAADFKSPGLTTFPIAIRGTSLMRGGSKLRGSPRRNDRIEAPTSGGGSG